MLEAVRVRREGFSYRPFFSDFVTSYRAIAYPFTDEVVYCMHNCMRILYTAYILCIHLTLYKIGLNWPQYMQLGSLKGLVYTDVCMYMCVHCVCVVCVCVCVCVCHVCRVCVCVLCVCHVCRVCGVGCEADRGGLSGDPGESRTDRLATGSKQGLPALLPRAQAAAATQRNGGWGHPYTEDVPWLPSQGKVSYHLYRMHVVSFNTCI